MLNGLWKKFLIYFDEFTIPLAKLYENKKRNFTCILNVYPYKIIENAKIFIKYVLKIFFYVYTNNFLLKKKLFFTFAYKDLLLFSMFA